ncbi:16S rRNA (adenine(1518)-N(6)/adenine(1519)-N(6))-dimethyltransferase RsmA [Mycolicibacterium insubricum]|nr:16S rRNA (adenine(1518)-N(6)/adenine(1519)-N(6))-dimethyltransferase RsmA [Mycolicibacterium insubricum]
MVAANAGRARAAGRHGAARGERQGRRPQRRRREPHRAPGRPERGRPAGRRRRAAGAERPGDPGRVRPGHRGHADPGHPDPDGKARRAGAAGAQRAAHRGPDDEHEPQRGPGSRHPGRPGRHLRGVHRQRRGDRAAARRQRRHHPGPRFCAARRRQARYRGAAGDQRRRLGRAGQLRVRRQLGHQHRQRLLRRRAVRRRHLAGPRWRQVRTARRPGHPRRADRHRFEDPGRAGLGRLAGVQLADRRALTIRLLGPAEIRALAAELGLRPRKSWGQNFVHDANTVRRIVAAAGVGPCDTVIEVGPGLGSLTLALLDAGANVLAVEVDPVLAGRLPQTLAERSPLPAPLTVVNTDVLTLRRGDLPASPEPTALVANLPYNIAVPALMTVLAEFPTVATVLIMVQLEVADRLAAEPGGRDYGVPSVKARFYGDVRRAGTVSPSVFWPVPRVDSGLVRIDRYDDPPWPTDPVFRDRLFRLIDVAFAQRRKTVRNALSGLAGSGEAAATLLREAGIDPSARAETLSVADFARLATLLPDDAVGDRA